MKKSISKTEASKKIQNFFQKIDGKTPQEIKKIKKLAQGYNFSLKEKRKLFCKKCFNIYQNPKVRINKKFKSVTCENCGNVSRWKLK